MVTVVVDLGILVVPMVVGTEESEAEEVGTAEASVGASQVAARVAVMRAGSMVEACPVAVIPVAAPVAHMEEVVQMEAVAAAEKAAGCQTMRRPTAVQFWSVSQRCYQAVSVPRQNHDR